MTIYKSNFDRRKQRVRRKLRKSSEGALRLSVYKSNSNVYAQIIDDKAGATLVAASTLDADILKELGRKVANVQAAQIIGKAIARKAQEKGIAKNKMYFDRGGYKYHGIVKAIADSARESGLEF